MEDRRVLFYFKYGSGVNRTDADFVQQQELQPPTSAAFIRRLTAEMGIYHPDVFHSTVLTAGVRLCKKIARGMLTIHLFWQIV